MSDSGSALLVGMFVGLVGAALFMYGRKQRRAPHLVGGLVLIAFPWFVSDALLTGGIAVAVVLLVFGATRLGA